MSMIVICIAAGLAAAALLALPSLNTVKGKIFRKKTASAQKVNSEKRSEAYVIHYDTYTLTLVERYKYAAAAAVVLFVTGYLFFHNMYLSLLVCSFSLLYPRYRRKTLIARRKNLLNQQFKEALYALSASLSAGKSVEKAFKACQEDLRILYADGVGDNQLILRELELINRRIEMNDTVENALADLAQRAHSEDISSFVDVFGICRGTGGNLVEVIRNSTGIIAQKLEVKSEIEILMAEQKLSQKILGIMPFVLLLLITTSSPDYIEPLYSPGGNLIMLIVLLLLVLSLYISHKIMDIKV
jgi:tight adherence protein B